MFQFARSAPATDERDQSWYFIFRSSGYTMHNPEDLILSLLEQQGARDVATMGLHVFKSLVAFA